MNATTTQRGANMGAVVAGAAAGMITGAVVATLVDERKRKLVGKKLYQTSRQAKDALTQLQQKATDWKDQMTSDVQDKAAELTRSTSGEASDGAQKRGRMGTRSSEEKPSETSRSSSTGRSHSS